MVSKNKIHVRGNKVSSTALFGRNGWSFKIPFLGSTFVLQNKKNIKRDQERVRTVAMLAPADNPVVRTFLKGFVDTLSAESNVPLTFYEYSLKPDKDISNDVSTISDNPYDLIFSFGLSCTRQAMRATRLNGLNTPIFFGGIVNATRKGLTEFGNGNVTGIETATLSRLPHALLLLSQKPTIRSVVIPFNKREPWQRNEADELSTILQSYGIEVHAVPITSLDTLKEDIRPYLDVADTIMTLDDNLLDSKIETLRDMCNERGITLFTSNPDGVERGAAIGLGTGQHEMGAECAQRARAILEHNVRPAMLPVTRSVHTGKVFMNRDTMLQQGLFGLPTQVPIRFV